MDINIDIQVACSGQDTPSETLLRCWALAAITPEREVAELSLRLVEAEEIQQLNSQYRHKDKPTNVLAFPVELPPGVDVPLLGDVVICADIVKLEALEQNKPLNAHWAHMVIHGTLHLLGYDHIDAEDAERMEARETAILAELGFPAPYVGQ